MAESKSVNLTKRATYELRQRIIHGGLPGGTRLYEVALSEDLQISRTPVREAMSRLAEEGLLERAPGGGFQVRSFTLRDVTDAIELRGVLEGTAARLAAEQGAEPRALAEIGAILDRLDACFATGTVGAIDFDGYSELNAQFHTRLAELCQSPVILRELERVKSLPFASPSAFVLGSNENARSFHSLVVAQVQHRAMVQAIERREGARAEAIAREHARIARANLESTFVTDAQTPEAMPGIALIVREGRPG
ncbi:GntR family transcriptional regulator [Pararhodobacter aggregans]|uniref:GntR family transcriptional regulator n=1 Tax=Pararhodobacter aggregans TaxID=404875 RepID=A0A2T7UX03_9RHOB|nr:GntR family transcriptional regulator [Pararhodobacter aggregans]PTX04991.1 GntR family transcriptional regulator [Pararhodobacter aggregans]PVE49310.1 GntR family transcriptional regulator [Pararhodobacter aggregans]